MLPDRMNEQTNMLSSSASTAASVDTAEWTNNEFNAEKV